MMPLTVVDHLPGLVYRCQNDEHWTFLFANAGCLHLTGYPINDLTSGNFHYAHLIDPEDRERVRERVQRGISKKEPYTLEFRLVTATGEKKWVWGEGQGVYSEKGVLLFLEGFVIDVTHQYKIEQRNKILKHVSYIALKAGHQEEMLEEVLGVVLKTFACDRAWLIYPCDPDAETFKAIKEVTRSEWPGADRQNLAVPIVPAIAEVFRRALFSEHPNAYDSETGWPEDHLPINVEFHIQSMLVMCIKPKVGKPWLFGIHHCAKPYVFLEEDRQLFYEITQQLTEALSIFLSIQELHKKESALAEAQRIAHIGNWELNFDENTLTWSDEVYRIFGQSQEFLPTLEGFFQMVHPDDREQVEQTFRASIQQKKTYNISHRLLLKDGSIKYVNERCETYYGPSGNAVRSFGIVQDITEQKVIEEKLRQSAVIVDNTADAIEVTDQHNKIIEVNRAYSRITGYEREEVLGNDPGFSKSGKHGEKFYKSMWQDIRNKGMWQGEIWNKRKNGEIYPVWQTISTVRDQDQAVLNYVSVFSDISMIKKSQEKIDFLAHHDPLTGLPNRILFNDRLDHALRRAQRDKQQVGLIFLDLDHFKNINDSLGHPMGDVILQKVAKRIKENIRDVDTVARHGGDEFVIIMEESQQALDVVVLAHKLIMAFANPFKVEEHCLHLSISMGISLYPKDARNSETLISNADAAMYRAKEEGRNNFQFYTREMTQAAFKRLTLESELHYALKENELVLHYQPQYSLASGEVTNLEALIRWNHPKLGLILPDKFIPFSEESNLILLIGEWVLETACEQMQRWIKGGLKLQRVAVNMSGVQFQRGNIVDTIVRILEKTKLAPERLEIEITESAIMQRMDQVVRILDELSQMGVTIAIDDFGTGYSSLSYLKRLPINRLKIDKSFVRDIPQDLNDVAITRAVNALGKSLQVGVVAEGVETKEQWAFLKAIDCNEAQGYYFSQPVVVEDVPSFLRRE